MKEWRVRGFVPDSDNDDEGLDEESQRLSNYDNDALSGQAVQEPENGSPSTTSSKLQRKSFGRSVKEQDVTQNHEHDLEVLESTEGHSGNYHDELSSEFYGHASNKRRPSNYNIEQVHAQGNVGSGAAQGDKNTLVSSHPQLPLADMQPGEIPGIVRTGKEDIALEILDSPPPLLDVNVLERDRLLGVGALHATEIQKKRQQPQHRVRTFRPRKQIQLHPYQVLDGGYKNQMRAAGIAPTRVIIPFSARNEQTSESENESDIGPGVENSQSESQMSSEPVIPSDEYDFSAPLGSQLAAIRSSPSSGGDDDDLPSLHDLMLPSKTSDKLTLGAKRQKLQHVAKELGNGVPVVFNTNQPHMTTMRLESGVDIPSPRSSSHTSPDLPAHNNRKVFQVPPGCSPPKPPTPATSSSITASCRIAEEEEVDQMSPVRTRTSKARLQKRTLNRAAIEIEDDTVITLNSESPSEEENSTGELGVMRRRIKGVLPASWLRLDAQAQGQSKQLNSAKTKHLSAAGVEKSQAGLARRRTGPQSRWLTPSVQQLVLSDDFASPSPSGSTRSPRIGPLASPIMIDAQNHDLAEHLGLLDDSGEDMEDNGVDFMLPSIMRNGRKTSGDASRKLQTTLADTLKPGLTQHKQKTTSGIRRKPTQPTQPTHPKNSEHNARYKAPSLSILDVLPSSPENPARVPTFLKVARRQASKQPGNARQQPSRKTVRLRTYEDTQDAKSVLQDWRNGRIKPRSQTGFTQRISRQPLVPRSTPSIQGTSRWEPNTSAISAEASRHHARSKSAALDQENQGGKQKRMASRNLTAPLRRPPRSEAQIQAAQLEAEEDAVDITQDRLQFRSGVERTSRVFGIVPNNAPQSVLQAMHNLDDLANRHLSTHVRSVPSNERITEHHPSGQGKHQKQPRKRISQRVDIESRVYRQPEAFMVPSHHRSCSVEAPYGESSAIQGLNALGIPHARDFDIWPLPAGTFFHETTFIGSGVFSRTLNTGTRDLDVDVGHHATVINGHSCRWGSWNEEMATDVKFVLSELATGLGSASARGEALINDDVFQVQVVNSIVTVRRILELNCEWLWFSDPIDRFGFVSVFLDGLEDLRCHIDATMVVATRNSHGLIGSTLLRLVTQLLALVGQVLSIVATCPTESESTQRCHALLTRCTDFTMGYLWQRGFDEIRVFYDQVQHHSFREGGIREEQSAIEAVVVMIHLLKRLSITGLSFWSVFNTKGISSIVTTNEVGILEKKWFDLFTVLPLQEIDVSGVLHIGHRLQKPFENWDAVNNLLSCVLTRYAATAEQPSSRINKYVRTLLTRCHHLIQNWAWRRCESMISLVFDFFAKRKYASLQNEDARGSPRFLEHLSQMPSLEVESEDQTFPIFLKIIAVALLGMRNTYDNKKIRGIAWRWLPNHSRIYSKEQDMHTADLDALRNQHDLLCTLYWASPPDFRLRPNMIQELVDHSASHIAACRLNIKSWSNLAAFQLSTSESIKSINPFADWMKDVLEQSVGQYKLARPQLETQYDELKANGSTITWDAVQSTISRNQEGIAASLEEAIAGMKFAVEKSSSVAAAWQLLQSLNIQVVFTLFEAKKKRTNSVLFEVINVFNALLKLVSKEQTVLEPEPESQDYGAFPEMDELDNLDELALNEPCENIARTILGFLLEQTHHLLSNVFGSEAAADDKLLTTIVENWAHLACTMVQRTNTDLDNFLGDYGKHSWNQLRDTDHKRKYEPYLWSCLLHRNSRIAQECRGKLLAVWLSSLVEREALMKYQHSLTMELLNSCPLEPLLQNLPFARTLLDDGYTISASDLRERRLALLASVLSNMRDHHLVVEREDRNSARELKMEYISLLKVTMSRMKGNYEELKQGKVVTGSYVSFVQSMIESMQQYTVSICPVDKFFTDSSAFPLPAHDPTYLVGRLKGYETRLDDPGAVKQLSYFIQNISERAAVDRDQDYLADQLETVLSGAIGPGNHEQMSLNAVLIQSIFPAYIDGALNDSPCWILVRPVLRACSKIMKDFLYNFSATDAINTLAASTMLMSFLSALQKAVIFPEYHAEMFKQAHILSTLGLIVDAATTCIPPLDYIRRRTGLGTAAAGIVTYFREFTLYVGQMLLGQEDCFPPDTRSTDNLNEMETAACYFEDLQTYLKTQWRTEGGRHYVKRGPNLMEVIVDLGDVNEEGERLIEKLETFHDVLMKARAF